MGNSMVIDQGELDTDMTFEKGFGVVSLVCRDTCGSKRIMMGHTTHYPGTRNQEHIHTNCEVMWFVLNGHSMHYSTTIDHEEYVETECFPGTVGFVAPNEIHVGMNVNDEEIGEVIFVYAGVNDKDDAGTVFVQGVEVVEKYMEARGKKLEDLKR